MRKLQIGFTLIELLVTISIIGLLAAISVFGVQGIFENARDAQRKSDLKQYQSALESFANKSNGMYPSYTTETLAATTLCTKMALSSCPADPKSGFDYKYQTADGTGGGTSDATEYFLWAQMETGSFTNWVVCSNGKSGGYSSPNGIFGFTSCPI